MQNKGENKNRATCMILYVSMVFLTFCTIIAQQNILPPSPDIINIENTINMANTNLLNTIISISLFSPNNRAELANKPLLNNWNIQIKQELKNAYTQASTFPASAQLLNTIKLCDT